MDNTLALVCGISIPIPECQLVIHQPTIKEIAFMGESDFFTAIHCLTIDKNQIIEDETSLFDMNNFQIFMTIMTEKHAADKKEAVLTLLSILFPNHKISLLPRSILFSCEGTNAIIDETNFEVLQMTFRQIFCMSSSMMGQDSFNPADDSAREIAKKLMRGRQRVAAQKGEEKKHSLFSQYISILTVGLNSMSLEDCMNLTMYQLFDLIERYGLYTAWDIDIRAKLAGGSSDTTPDNWMKNIH